MKNVRSFLVVTIILMAAAAAALAASTAVEILEIQSLIDTRDLWPGFDPGTIPVAIFDGENTFLTRHPSPPEGFKPLVGHEGILVSSGRHPAIVANTSSDLNGILTAVVMIGAGSAGTAEEYASIVVHESFHVFQKSRYGNWGFNEASTFTYPADDAQLWALRKQILLTMKKAVLAAGERESAGWAKAALELRGQRFELSGDEIAAYDRGVELYEGTARYVQLKCLGRLVDGCFEDIEYLPTQVREPGYTTGCAMAILLDRFLPGWKDSYDPDKPAGLDVLLKSALDGIDVEPASLDGKTIDSISKKAGDDSRAVVMDRERKLKEFLDKPGWKIVLEANPDEPFWPNGFDPNNVVCVNREEVLHNRFVKFANSYASIETMDIQVLSYAAGEHPLFNGIRKVVVTGLAGRPEVTDDGEYKKIVMEHLKLFVKGATIVADEREKTIRVSFSTL